MAREVVYDELICFLGDVLFQIPVRSFMDENSIIFDPSVTPGEDHRKIHVYYKKLVDTLLEGFCADNKITLDQAIKGIKSMNQVPDLQEVFQVIFEQVLATVDFEVFYSSMCKRNILIQEQALVLLLSRTGQLPASLMQDDQGEEVQARSSKKGGASSKPMVSENREDEDILRKAMMESQHEEQVRNQRVAQQDRELQKTLAMSQMESDRLNREKKALEQDMQKLSVSDKLPTQSTSAAPKPMPTVSFTAAAATAASRPAPRQPMVARHPPPSDISNSNAASDWLKTAQAEASKSTTHAAVVAEMSKMSPGELKKRQEYLQEQRDKLMAMKKEQRENQLTTAVKTSKRPSSARAARNAMAQSTAGGAAVATPSQTEEDEKKMAMRRAIADKLKMEVIGK